MIIFGEVDCEPNLEFLIAVCKTNIVPRYPARLSGLPSHLVETNRHLPAQIGQRKWRAFGFRPFDYLLFSTRYADPSRPQMKTMVVRRLPPRRPHQTKNRIFPREDAMSELLLMKYRLDYTGATVAAHQHQPRESQPNHSGNRRFRDSHESKRQRTTVVVVNCESIQTKRKGRIIRISCEGIAVPSGIIHQGEDLTS
jgi:hypothetical protein